MICLTAAIPGKSNRNTVKFNKKSPWLVPGTFFYASNFQINLFTDSDFLTVKLAA